MVRPGRHPGPAWARVGILLVGLLVAGPARAHQPGGHRPALLTPADHAALGPICWHRAQARLGLTEQQVTDRRTLLDAQRATARTRGQRLLAARPQLRTLLALRAPFPPDQWPQWQALRKGMAHHGMQRAPGGGPGLSAA